MISINKKNNLLLWKVNEEISINTEVRVGSGVECLVVRNGELFNKINSNNQETINTKRRTNDIYELYGVNINTDIPVNFGTSEPVKFFEKNYNLNLEIKGFGSAYAYVTSAENLFRKLSLEKMVKIDDIDEYIGKSLSRTFCELLSQTVKDIHSKDEVEDPKFKGDLEEKFRAVINKEICNQYGIGVTGAKIEQLRVRGYEEIDKISNGKVIESKRNELDKLKSENFKEQISIINELNSSLSNKNENVKEEKKQENDSFKYCMKCGAKLPVDAVFCIKCGNKQDI